ncbi:MAG: glycosyltransferase family 39 protein [Candidatus Krumholzibacteria bacterium]|nr:glycosyltransferase family 39 protein [Candidatus Krumholzibacteria bacterium]
MISGAVLVMPCVLLAWRLWDRRAALFCGVLIALHPTLIVFSTAAMTESLYALLLVLSLFLLVRYMQDGGRWAPVLIGAVLGLTYQTRQEAQFFLALAVIVILLGRGGEGLKGILKVRVGRAVVVVVFFILVNLPHAVLLHQKTGHWMSGSKASVNLSSPHIWQDGLERERYVYSLNKEGTGRRVEEIGRENTAVVLWRQKGAIASEYFYKLDRGIDLIPFLLATPFLLFLVPLGLFGRRWNRGHRGAELVVLIMGIFPFLFYPIFRIDIRYVVPFLPLYLMWAARGCVVIVDWLRENVTPRPVPAAVVLLVVFLSLVPVTIRRYSWTRNSQPVEYAEIGRWIRENEGEGARVLAHSGCSIGYYAGNPKAAFIPWTDVQGLLRYARYHDFDYLVVDENYIGTYRPTLIELLEGPRIRGLHEVRTFTRKTGGKIVLYRFEPVS